MRSLSRLRQGITLSLLLLKRSQFSTKACQVLLLRLAYPVTLGPQPFVDTLNPIRYLGDSIGKFLVANVLRSSAQPDQSTSEVVDPYDRIGHDPYETGN